MSARNLLAAICLAVICGCMFAAIITAAQSGP